MGPMGPLGPMGLLGPMGPMGPMGPWAQAGARRPAGGRRPPAVGRQTNLSSNVGGWNLVHKTDAINRTQPYIQAWTCAYSCTGLSRAE